LTWLFAVLLLGLQQATQLHAISHLAGLLDRPHEQGLQVPPSDPPCVLCALCAGGSNAIASEAAAVPSIAAPSTATWVTAAAPTTSSPTYYLSRAPPTLL
jgi:hypothetical protein